jgi:hypothetical protein
MPRKEEGGLLNLSTISEPEKPKEILWLLDRAFSPRGVSGNGYAFTFEKEMAKWFYYLKCLVYFRVGSMLNQW